MTDIRPIDANAIPYCCGRIGKNFIDHMPTLDYAPVVHAQWITRGKEGTYCGACGNRAPFVDVYGFKKPYKTAFCPICGARMDK